MPGIEDRAEVAERVEREKERKERQKKKVVRTPSRQGHVPSASTAASLPPSISIPVTPSLKIRLPRIGNVNNHHASPAMLTASGDNAARL